MDDVYGLLAEFKSPDGLKAALERASTQGYRRIEAFTPFPIEGMDEILKIRDRRVPRAGLIGAICGAVSGFLLQVYASLDYPLNVGGRVPVPLPAFAVVTFELMILFAVMATIGTMLWTNGLPRLSHPLFNAARFHLASHDRFFLCIARTDPHFDRAATRAFLESLSPVHIVEVPL